MYLICIIFIVVLAIVVGALTSVYFSADYRIEELEKDLDALRNKCRKIENYLFQERRRKQ